MRTAPRATAPAVAAVAAAIIGCTVPAFGGSDACAGDHPCVFGTCMFGRCVDVLPTAVSVKRALLHVMEDGGIESEPDPRTDLTMLVVLPDGGPATVEPVMPDAGLYAFYAAPAGTYVLRLGTRYVVSSARNLDLSEYRLGRADGVVPTAGTAVAVRLSGLSAWSPSLDAVQVSCAGAGLGAMLLSDQATWLPPSAGATMAQADVPWSSSLSPYLIQASRGDILHTEQLRWVQAATANPDGGPSATVLQWSAIRAAATSDVEMSNGATAGVDAGLSALVAASAAFAVRTSAYAALVPDLGANASFGGVMASIRPVLGGAALGPYAEMPTLHLAFLDEPTDATLSPQFVWAYGSTWEQTVQVQLSATVSVTAGASTFDEEALVKTSSSTSALSGAVGPRLGPPTAITIGAGMEPWVQWLAPTLGTPDGYTVLVRRLVNAAGVADPRDLAILSTTSAQVRLPPGLLKPGEWYVLHVQAVRTGHDLATVPFLGGPHDVAEAVSAAFGR